MRYAVSIVAGLIAMGMFSAPAAQTVRQVFQDNYVEANGQRLHHASVGKGPLVLFLHGYPSFWYQWKDQMAEIAVGQGLVTARDAHGGPQCEVAEGGPARI